MRLIAATRSPMRPACPPKRERRIRASESRPARRVGRGTPDPSRLPPMQLDHESGGATGQAMRDAEDQDGGRPLHRALQPEAERGRDALIPGERPLAEIERHHGEARTAGEEIGGAKGRRKPPAALHPQQARELDARRHGRGGIERIGAIDQRDLAARRRGAGEQGQEQAAASGGPGTDDLAEPSRGESAEQEIYPSRVPPWRGQGFHRDSHLTEPLSVCPETTRHLLSSQRPRTACTHSLLRVMRERVSRDTRSRFGQLATDRPLSGRERALEDCHRPGDRRRAGPRLAVRHPACRARQARRLRARYPEITGGGPALAGRGRRRQRVVVRAEEPQHPDALRAHRHMARGPVASDRAEGAPGDPGVRAVFQGSPLRQLRGQHRFPVRLRRRSRPGSLQVPVPASERLPTTAGTPIPSWTISTRPRVGRWIPSSGGGASAPSKSASWTRRRTTSTRCSGTGSCRTARGCAAGRSRRATTSTISSTRCGSRSSHRPASSRASNRAVARVQSNCVVTNVWPSRAIRSRKAPSSTSRPRPRARASTSRRGATTAVRPSIA